MEYGGSHLEESKETTQLSEAEEAEGPERRLNQLTCTPQKGSDPFSDLKVAFSNTLEADICSLQEPKVGNSEMRTQCNEFCQPKGISLLIGSAQYGFDKTGAEEICLPPNGVLKHDPEQLERCGQWSQGFQEVEIATAQFIAQLDVFDAARLEHAAAMVEATLQIQAYVTSEAFAKDMSRAIDKASLMIKAVNDRLVGGPADERLRAEITNLKLQTKALKDSLDKNMKLIQQFLEQCNSLYVGVGPQQEYLLDICAQKSVACLEHPRAGHVTCCCAYHPFMAFGEQLPSSIISGIDAWPLPARVAEGRRLRRLSVDVPTDICAAAWTEALPKVSEARGV